MTQQNNTVSLLLQDINGQQQMIKVVQGTTSKSLNPMVKTTIGGQTIKGIFKATSSQEAGQSLLTTNQVLKTIGVTGKLGPRFVHLQPATQGTQKFMEGQTLQKIQLSPSQMAASGLKLITTSQQQKSPSPQQQQSQPVSPNTNKTYISPILDHTGARKRHTVDSEYNPPEYKRRRSDKVGKGLRHFSMKVCEKVRKKGTTSYNEVADELVSEFTNPAHMANSAAEQYDQKNIRRRVYDALNVLMAMNIISKEKKEIRWLGLPTNSLQEYIQLEKEKQRRMNSIKQKEQQLRDLIYQQISFKNLVERNKEHQRMYGVPSTNSTIPLPFIIVNTDKKTQVECSISNDKMEYCFSFDNTFEINDDIEVLKKAGMLMGLDKGEISEENIKKAKSMLPKSLGSYVEKLAAQPDLGDNYIDSAGPSGSPGAVEYVETCLGEGEASRQSSFSDPLSPNILDFSDDEPDSEDLSSDIDIN